ncbi:MAG: PatB family C-S lyase [Chloroflexota bacterium]
MPYDFDRRIERSHTNSSKWTKYGADVLPMWVADMDFQSPPAILRAMQMRLEHGVFGYEWPTSDLTNMLCARMERLYGWRVDPEWVVFIPGLVYGLNNVCRAVGQPGEDAIMFSPIYPPMLSAPANQGLTATTVELRLMQQGNVIHYEADFDQFEAAIKPNTALFIHCHPHNPTGHEYTRAENLRLAELCAKHNLAICSDEIHCDLLMDGTQHMPIAALAPEIAERTITLMAPSKTFNMPSLDTSFAIIPNAELRRRVKHNAIGLHINAMGLAAVQAAYTECDDWLMELRQYLTANRDTLVDYLTENMPDIGVTVPEATYLAWLDCRRLPIHGTPHEFFLNHAKVAVNDGATFGPGGDGFVRFNYGCPRSQLLDALERMKNALHTARKAHRVVTDEVEA